MPKRIGARFVDVRCWPSTEEAAQARKVLNHGVGVETIDFKYVTEGFRYIQSVLGGL
jgi:hypothetical protein